MKIPSLLVLMRHAESMDNFLRSGMFWRNDDERKPMNGAHNRLVKITAEGWRQAGVVGAALRARFGVFDVVYNSGYTRTIETMNGVLNAYSEEEKARMEIISNALLRERETGYAYGMTEAEVDANFPWLKEYWRTADKFLACPPGGESLVMVSDRERHFLRDELAALSGKRVLVILHGNSEKMLRYLLEKWDNDQLEKELRVFPPNASITVYENGVRSEVNAVYWGP